jgi:hypothetical protein
MASKKKAVSAGSEAIAAAAAARENPYVQRLIEDADLRDDLRTAYESARKAHGRINGKGPAKAFEDKKVQQELKQAAESLKSAADSLRGPVKRQKKKRGIGRVLIVGIVGAGLALALSEGLRKKVLDGLFGAEEEFEYTASTTPAAANGSTAASEKVASS